jgi:hypothetical protein
MYCVAVAILRFCNHLLAALGKFEFICADVVIANTAKMSSEPSCLINDRFRADARMMRDMLRARVYAAREYICQKLGFNGWSRDLHDNMEAYAFLIPEELFSNFTIVSNLKMFIEDVFSAHFLEVAVSSIMQDSSQDSIRESMGEDYDPERYCVDWHGSRCRDVELGPHIYFRLSFSGWVSHRIRKDPEVPEQLRGYRWEVRTEQPSESEIKQWAEISTAESHVE